MARYNEDNYMEQAPMNRQRDLVLSTNEFCFLQSKTNGAIKTYTGPITMTISAQENLVIFDAKTKRFNETQDFEKARQIFVSAPEGWYIVLKNPAEDGSHPEAAKAVNSPTLEIGHKINIPGPTSFSLFPGQMTRVIRGHRLRSNQYLLARVYDAEAAKKSNAEGTMIDAEGNEVKAKQEDYFVGQLLVIKGTEVSFYIPPTGIEVIPINAENGEGTGAYVRDAITLERLEYAILKDEDGEKRYIHGPSVVFPKPTETFVSAPKGGYIFRALELSPISGIYVKVIAEYDEVKNGKKVHHPIGEELFITGNDQMIYYPRPEHAMIQYDGKYMHHAIAIPEGEGRYILNRLTGTITTIKGPRMYLPDPRTEVVVKRKLTPKECSLMYPNNSEVIKYNSDLSEKTLARAANKGLLSNPIDILENFYSTGDQEATLAIFEANANISRGTSYTKPRTITLDTKYEGVVSIDVWTGYAINVTSKTGKREVVAGPATRLLDYDETVEAIKFSCGTPKSDDKTVTTAFLRVANNRVSDIIEAQTSDCIDVSIHLNYWVTFQKEYQKDWFAIENYVKYLSDNMRSLVKRTVRGYDFNTLYANYTTIIRNAVLDIKEGKKEEGRLFKVNGMLVTEVDIINLNFDNAYQEELDEFQRDVVFQKLKLDNARARENIVKEIAESEQRQNKCNHEVNMKQLALKQEFELTKLANDAAQTTKKDELEAARFQARMDMQEVLNAIQTAEVARRKENDTVEAEKLARLAEIEKAKQQAYADTIKEILGAIQPGLIEAISASSKAEILKTGMEAIGPYALAEGKETIPDTINKLVRGTTLENVFNSDLFKTSK